MDAMGAITIGGVVIANISTTVFLFTWATNHAAQDTRANRNFIDESRKETNAILLSIHAEIKDFHGRLCDIEARSRGLNDETRTEKRGG